MNIFILTFHKYDKAFASDLYLIYNRSPAARVCKSDTDRLLMLYLVLTQLMTSHVVLNQQFIFYTFLRITSEPDEIEYSSKQPIGLFFMLFQIKQ